jgi:AcrR family transcriptional regulator
MNAKEEAIVTTAMQVFSRYGIRKTTMGDIAEAAGVSRQTLYNAYANKDEVLRAVIRLSTDQGIAAAKAAWSETDDFATKLDIFFEIGPLFWFDTVQAHPESADLLEGANKATSDALEETAKRWAREIGTLTEPFGPVLQKTGMTPKDLADFIFSTSKAAKYTAENRAQMITRLNMLKASVLALISSTP